MNGKLTTQSYGSEIVNDIREVGARLKPDARQLNFQQDCARVHTAVFAKKFFQANYVTFFTSQAFLPIFQSSKISERSLKKELKPKM